MPSSSARSSLALPPPAWLVSKPITQTIGTYTLTHSSAQIYLDSNRTIAEISPLLFGGFVEHMGRCVYEGIYDPESPHADENGLRTDVLDALRDQKYTTIRYPGGNFLSGYNWLDGVGPKDQRPRRRELAWQSLETNQFGTNEFMDFCKAINAAPMMAVNMGTGTIQSAADLVEYCNTPSGTSWSDLRAQHGYQAATMSAIGVWATRWMARGRSAIWKSKNMGPRPAKPPS